MEEIKNNLEQMLLDYAINNTSAADISEFLKKDEDNVKLICTNFEQEWHDTPCDEEGANVEQDSRLDDILNEYINQLIEL